MIHNHEVGGSSRLATKRKITETSVFMVRNREIEKILLKGVYNLGDPPLSIPNREVKPQRADVPSGGRVGRCRISEASCSDATRFLFWIWHVAAGCHDVPG